MINTSRQLKDLIRNLSKEKSADAQLLMRNFMMERLLERLSLSEYSDHFILKGGVLVSSMLGLGARSTMDIDTSMRGIQMDPNMIDEVFSKIIKVPVEDNVKFQIVKISEIMDDLEYGGVRVNLIAHLDAVRIPIKVDISTGDIITPREVHYPYQMMFENRTITVWAYNLETLLAEKLETVIARDVTNTRMRDFYDICSLMKLYESDISSDIFRKALESTARERGTLVLFTEASSIFEDLENSTILQRYWSLYQEKFPYASKMEWTEIMETVRKLYGLSSPL